MYSVPLLAQLNDKVFNSLKAIFSFPALRSISVTGSDQFRHDMSFELMGIVESKDAQSLERAYFSLLNSRHSGFSPTTIPPPATKQLDLSAKLLDQTYQRVRGRLPLKGPFYLSRRGVRGLFMWVT